MKQSLRRIKPDKRTRSLAYRTHAELPFFSSAPLPLPLLLDTTVYIDEFQNRLPFELDKTLREGPIWHCTVTEAELSALAGLLNPTHPNTHAVIEQLASSIELRLEHRILTPDREIWREAGILAGLLARLQGYSKTDQRRTLNDALIFLTAAKYGCAVLTRNVADFDLLMQLDGRGQAVFYDRL